MRAKSRSDEGASVNVMPPLEQLRSQLRGRVIEPGDLDYDQAKTVFYGGEERHPTKIGV
jgi:hypothetical protein